MYIPEHRERRARERRARGLWRVEPEAASAREPRGRAALAYRVFGTLPPGGGANLTTLTHLGGGSDPPSKKFNTLGGGV